MNILVIDDHVLIRQALQSFLKRLNRDASVYEASNCREAIQVLERYSGIDLVLLDLNLPDRDGFSVLAELRQRYATTAVVVLSASHDRETVKRALDLGALGFIPKTTEDEVMLSALRLVLSGGIYIPREILCGEDPSGAQTAETQITTTSSCELLSGLGLTRRQIEVLRLLVQGRSNKVISHMLNMAEPTVKNHVTAILKALKVTNRTEAAIKVEKLGCL